MAGNVWWLGAAFIPFGLIFLAIGLTGFTRHRRRVKTWHAERACVVGYEWRGGGDDSVQHWTMERLDPLGRTHRTSTEFGVAWGTLRSFPFEVDVLVNPRDESDFVLKSGARSGAASLAFAVAGLLFLGIGAALLWVELG